MGRQACTTVLLNSVVSHDPSLGFPRISLLSPPPLSFSPVTPCPHTGFSRFCNPGGFIEFQEFKCHLNAADLGLKSRLSAPLGCRFHSSVPLGHPSDMSNLTCLPLIHTNSYKHSLYHQPGPGPRGHAPLSCCRGLNLLGKHLSLLKLTSPSLSLGVSG